MQVSQLWRYPVKSMLGGTVDEIELDDLGIVGDRTWATRDLERGGIRGAKKIGELMKLAARDLPGGEVEIVFPDGTTVSTEDSVVHERLTAALGREVRLERLEAASNLDHFRRGLPDSDDPLVEIRGIMGREEDEPLPDFSIFPSTIMEFESPPGTYYDAFPLLVMTESALTSLAAALPGSAIDERRFRPSIVIDTGGDGDHPEFDHPELDHPELEWRGMAATIGTATIRFEAPCPRCVMVTREIDDTLPADRGILRYIVRELDQNVGMYATVETPGTVRLGDTVRFG